ncbi:CYP4F2 [Branchiostoma lanceolatum]|uniref:CYP4F2 protein n=1 Tax=Branchiostoma lanceolatum TaxID=7740 RepID=A0A8J9YXE7_BRALA|nr:CYP4F2 [Branchiostoma lanceolatum]
MMGSVPAQWLPHWEAGYLRTACLTVLVAVVVQLVVRFIRALLWRRYMLKVLAPFPGNPTHWLFGHMREVRPDETGFTIVPQWAAKFKFAFPIWIGLFRVVLSLVHPDYIKEIVNSPEPKDRVSYAWLKPWIGDGLLVSEGQKWFRNRRLLTPGFHFDVLKPYVKVFSECTNIMLDRWADLTPGTPVEMFHYASAMTLDSLMRCALSVHSNCQQDSGGSPYIRAVYIYLTKCVVDRGRYPPFHMPLIFHLSPTGFRFRKECKTAHDFSDEVIRKRRAELQQKCNQNNTVINSSREGGKKRYLDFLDILLQARDEDGKGLSEREIRDEVDTFMFEGHDTTASGVSWIFYNLAKHAACQDRCRAEVDNVLQGRAEVKWEDLSKLPYTTMCIKESLRMHSPVPGVTRLTTQPHTFPDGRSIPAGVSVSIGVHSLHHNIHVWGDNVMEFDPERFSPENSKGRSSHAFIPFSAGSRNCIGQHFAMNELKVAVALTLQRYRLELDETRPPYRVARLITRTRDGLWLKVYPRGADN